MESSRSNGRNKTLIWIAGGCAAILICALAVFLFGFGGLYWLGSQTAQEVTVSWDMPTGIDIDEIFEFKIIITNVSAIPVRLVSIDFSTNYLRGFLMETTDPLHTNTLQYTPWGGGETFQAYSFENPIASGKSLTVVFNGKTVISGDYSGTVAVCINSTLNCKLNIVRTIVR